MKKLILLLSIITASVSFASVSFAQTYTISGRITDYNGLPIDSCSVIIYNPDFSEVLEALSDVNEYIDLTES